MCVCLVYLKFKFNWANCIGSGNVKERGEPFQPSPVQYWALLSLPVWFFKQPFPLPNFPNLQRLSLLSLLLSRMPLPNPKGKTPCVFIVPTFHLLVFKINMHAHSLLSRGVSSTHDKNMHGVVTGVISMVKSQSFQNDYKVLLVFISCFLCSNLSPLTPNSLPWLVLAGSPGWCQTPPPHSLQAMFFHFKSEAHSAFISLHPLTEERPSCLCPNRCIEWSSNQRRDAPTALTHLQTCVSAVSENQLPLSLPCWAFLFKL